jgi:epoxyqueuosine reductase
MNATVRKHTEWIKAKALEMGFSYCGISKAGFLEEEAPLLEKWLSMNMHGKMGYMENHFDKRLDPTRLIPGAKSVITFVYNYFPQKDIFKGKNYKISKYAYGTDYHFVIKEKLSSFLQFIEQKIGPVEGRAFVDSAPILERAWAKRSGAGWIGKHSLAMNRQIGSFFFLAELILDLELEYDLPIRDYCGTCTKCIDACPTEAIVAPGVVDSNRCISYLTIELKENIPADFKGKFQNWIFGCDICQDVCPWNRFAKPNNEQKFEPPHELADMKSVDWEEITNEIFNGLFKKSAVKRAKYGGLKRNILFEKESNEEDTMNSFRK